MSFLGKVFGGGKKQEKGPTPLDAIQRLCEIEDMLTKKQEYLEKKVKLEENFARKNVSKNKKAALQALKRKKRYEKQLGQIDGTLTTIEFQRAALENATTNTEILKTLDYANTVLQKTHGEMDADKVHEIIDDIHEQQELANEISEAISSPIGFHDEDEEDINEELERMLQEDLDEKLTEVAEPVTEDLPTPPSALPAKQRKANQEEETDMRELAQWAS